MNTFPTPADLGVEVLDHSELAGERRNAATRYERAYVDALMADRLHGVLSPESSQAHAIRLARKDEYKAAIRRELRAFGRLLP